MQHKTLYIILGCILFALIFRMCMFERRYYVSENITVVTNRLTNMSYKYRVGFDEPLIDKIQSFFKSFSSNKTSSKISDEELFNSGYVIKVEN